MYSQLPANGHEEKNGKRITDQLSAWQVVIVVAFGSSLPAVGYNSGLGASGRRSGQLIFVLAGCTVREAGKIVSLTTIEAAKKVRPPILTELAVKEWTKLTFEPFLPNYESNMWLALHFFIRALSEKAEKKLPAVLKLELGKKHAAPLIWYHQKKVCEAAVAFRCRILRALDAASLFLSGNLFGRGK